MRSIRNLCALSLLPALVWAAPSSETSKRSEGGYGFSSPLDKVDIATNPADASIAKVPGSEWSEVEALDARLTNLGLTKVSEGNIDVVRTATYSLAEESVWTSGTVRRAEPAENWEKRQDASTTPVNIEGNPCLTACGYDDKVSKANTSHCVTVYNTLKTKAVRFSVAPRTVTYFVYEDCAGFFVNNLANITVEYDFWDYGASTQWLNGACLIEKTATIGTCVFAQDFGSDYAKSVYISANHPSYFGL